MADYNTLKFKEFTTRKDMRPYDRLHPFLSENGEALLDFNTIEELFRETELDFIDDYKIRRDN